MERLDTLGEHTAGVAAGMDAASQPWVVGRDLVRAQSDSFPEISDERDWATRAMLGEELWITHRPKDGATVLSVVASLLAVVALVAARRHRALPAAVTTAAQMALTLVYWQQMVRYLDRHR
jgi:hypothetical protein